MWHSHSGLSGGSLSSVFIPAGRLGNRTDRERRRAPVRVAPLSLSLDDPCPVLAVKGSASPRFAPCTAPGRARWRSHHGPLPVLWNRRTNWKTITS